LIDGGSSDSFIHPIVTKFLNLPIELPPGFRVMVGNFEMMEAEGYIPTLEVNMQGHTMLIPQVYVLYYAGGELVIGTTWLKKLKAHIVDYHSSSIRLWQKGDFVTIYGVEFKGLKEARFHHIIQLQNKNAEK